MVFSAIFTGGRDVILAVLTVAVGAVLRACWTIQRRISRLEAFDEARERERRKDTEPREEGDDAVRDE